MKNVLVINEGFSHNLGDQAILDSTRSFYLSKGFHVEFLYLSKPHMRAPIKLRYTPTNLVGKQTMKVKFNVKLYLNFFYWIVRNFNVIVKRLRSKHFDIVSIGGGQLINTSGKNYPSVFAIALFWMTQIIIRFSPKTEIVYLGVGVATKFNSIERFLYSRALTNADKIFVRDVFSGAVLKSEFNLDSVLIPDIAFYKEDPVRELYLEKDNLVLVGIANYEEVVTKYNEGISKSEYYSEINDKIHEFILNGYKIKLFYTTQLDVSAMFDFNRYRNSNGHESLEITMIEDLEGLKSELAKCKVVYSGRMHALILGMKFQCDVLPFLLSQKLKSFNEDYVVNRKSAKILRTEIDSITRLHFGL